MLTNFNYFVILPELVYFILPFAFDTFNSNNFYKDI